MQATGLLIFLVELDEVRRDAWSHSFQGLIKMSQVNTVNFDVFLHSAEGCFMAHCWHLVGENETDHKETQKLGWISENDGMRLFLSFTSYDFQIPAPSKCWEIIENVNLFSSKISIHRGSTVLTSAPEYPSVRDTKSSTIISSDVGVLRNWILKISLLVSASGRGTYTMRSRRPGRNSACNKHYGMMNG